MNLLPRKKAPCNGSHIQKHSPPKPLVLLLALGFSPFTWSQTISDNETANEAELEEIVVRGASPKEKNYTESKSTVHISREDLNRFSVISTGDMLKGVAGVNVGDVRNGGGLDVNIRGAQGQNRVAVQIDGGEQMVNVYRGYSGTQQRSYVDPDLIGRVDIEKGVSLESGGSGSIAGVVRMQTLTARDILPEGKNWGIRLKSSISTNSIKPSRTSTASLADGFKWVMPRTDQSRAWENLGRSNSIAAAWRNERFELLGAYVLRQQGNYFAGDKGYVPPDRSRGGATWRNSVEWNYREDEEVLNTSGTTRSVLLKGRVNLNENHSLSAGYRRFEGKIGDIMPSAVSRREAREIAHRPKDTPGLSQWPVGETRINAYNVDYRYTPDNPLINFKAGIWATDTKSNLLNAASLYAPSHLIYEQDKSYAWSPQKALNIGVNLSNRSEWQNDWGRWKLQVGADYKRERTKPQSWVEIDEINKRAEQVIRNATRWEASAFGNLEFAPNDTWTFRLGGRYSRFANHDHNRWPEYTFNCIGNDCWEDYLKPPRVFPPTGFIPRDQITDAHLAALPLLPPKTYSGGGFAPSLGITWHFTPSSQLYVNYAQGIRLPAQFETSMGTANVRTTADLEPEKARNLEIGLSTVQKDLLRTGDQAMFKLAYFNNRYKNYITRFLDPTLYFSSSQFMYFRNLDRFNVSGFELQSSYDNGRVFADLSATYYQKARACDRFISGQLSQNRRIGAVPECVDGGFGSSYAAAQNPPKYMVNLTAGARFFNQKLTVGGRVTRTDGPIATMDKPWHRVVTTYQKNYRPVTTFDLFSHYQINKNAVLSLGVTNLTNRYYLDPLAQSFMPAPGRNWTLGFEMKF